MRGARVVVRASERREDADVAENRQVRDPSPVQTQHTGLGFGTHRKPSVRQSASLRIVHSTRVRGNKLFFSEGRTLGGSDFAQPWRPQWGRCHVGDMHVSRGISWNSPLMVSARFGFRSPLLPVPDSVQVVVAPRL